MHIFGGIEFEMILKRIQTKCGIIDRMGDGRQKGIVCVETIAHIMLKKARLRCKTVTYPLTNKEPLRFFVRFFIANFEPQLVLMCSQSGVRSAASG